MDSFAFILLRKKLYENEDIFIVILFFQTCRQSRRKRPITRFTVITSTAVPNIVALVSTKYRFVYLYVPKSREAIT